MKKQTHLSLTLFLLVLHLIFGNSAYAALVTHTWQETHRGYSIELVPGTDVNGVSAEYVAAGTVYDPAFPGETGWHFMRLDATGNVLNSRIAWCPLADLVSYRVVDIAAEPANGTVSNKFWITIQARPLSSGQKDYIYIQGVDALGNDLASNAQINIFSSDDIMPNIYPTHSYFLNNALYLCGYTTNETNFPNVPDNNASGKNGIFLKCDVNNTPFTNTFFTWDSDSKGSNDFDMPLKIAPASNDDDADLLVTGAVNSLDPQASAALVMKFDQAANLIVANGILYPLTSTGPDEVHGIYGIDIRGGVGYYSNPDDYIILVNEFSDNNPNDKSWGIIRTGPNFVPYPSNFNSFVHTTYQKGWAKQITDFSLDKNFYPHLHMIGEQTDVICNTPPAPDLPESKTNVNAFASLFYFDGPGIWYTGPTNYGWFSGSSTALVHNVYLSSQGTSAGNMDYLNGIFPYNTALEDVSRLYTFSSIDQPYDISGATVKDHAMILPLGEAPMTSTPDLQTKYLSVNGSTHTEYSCMRMVGECPGVEYTYTFSSVSFYSPNFEGTTVTIGADLNNNPYTPGYIDCTTGYYKTNRINDINAVVKPVSIYPNPATSYVNIQLDKELNNDKAGVFELADMSSKVVFQKSVVSNGKMLIKIDLPDVVPGLYTGTVIISGIKHVEKITIK
jgi:hypothetical protein